MTRKRLRLQNLPAGTDPKTRPLSGDLCRFRRRAGPQLSAAA